MVSYGIAKARAKAWRTDWNERTEITKAIITWVDKDYEYELEVENEDGMDDKEFTEWVEENAEDLAKEDAENNETTFEGINNIDFEEEYAMAVLTFPPLLILQPLCLYFLLPKMMSITTFCRISGYRKKHCHFV